MSLLNPSTHDVAAVTAAINAVVDSQLEDAIAIGARGRGVLLDGPSIAALAMDIELETLLVALGTENEAAARKRFDARMQRIIAASERGAW